MPQRDMFSVTEQIDELSRRPNFDSSKFSESLALFDSRSRTVDPRFATCGKYRAPEHIMSTELELRCQRRIYAARRSHIVSLSDAENDCSPRGYETFNHANWSLESARSSLLAFSWDRGRNG